VAATAVLAGGALPPGMLCAIIVVVAPNQGLVINFPFCLLKSACRFSGLIKPPPPLYYISAADLYIKIN
jgi:hypothetical protein